MSADDYSLALLMSIILTPHRFAIMEHLSWFLGLQAKRHPKGRLGAVGIGSGFELVRASRILSCWHIEGYDQEQAMCEQARKLLKFCQVPINVAINIEFPLAEFDPRFAQVYDALILCELCEHLRDPGRALVNAARYLKTDGQAFVTMAVNIAQEDHVFLYPSLDACRRQLEESELVTVSEWAIPQSAFVTPRGEHWRGNYVAVVSRRSGAVQMPSLGSH
ncbi:MAG TPA: class I SAM-dependent methyltransferase [Candidatus Binataceae bacterium]|nr:class I SAM-dependent methyltransferase [Candidatus Binataceae bacterium]